MSRTHILGDWGSTRLRLWLLRDGVVTDRRTGPGIVGLQHSPQSVLEDAIAAWLKAGEVDRITLCGMAGARGGLKEAPYVNCPASIDDWRGQSAPFELAGIAGQVAAGCATNPTRDVADDVMRGEETQIYGALSEQPELTEGRHTIVLPGTHSKWVTTEAGKITALRTFVTGELFALLQASSLLAAQAPGEDDHEGFAEGLSRASEGPGLLGSLFEARAAQLRRSRSHGWAQDFLSGLLIGSELAEMRAEGMLSAKVWLIGDPSLSSRYAEALASHGLSHEPLDGEICSLSGLRLLDADD